MEQAIKGLASAVEGINDRLDKMDRRFDSIEGRLDKMDERFERVEGRLDRMEGRLDTLETQSAHMTERLDSLEVETRTTRDVVTDVKERVESLERETQTTRDIVIDVKDRVGSLEQEARTTRDIVTDMELRFTERFDRLDGRLDHLVGVQKEMQADTAAVRHSLFIEEGSRESADESLFGEQRRDYVKLEKRVRVLEAKFPDLAQKQAA